MGIVQHKSRIRFEHHPSRVVFDKSSLSYVATWSKFGVAPEERLKARMDGRGWIPSVSAIADMYDRGGIPHENTVYAAVAIGSAFDAGDRSGLDTDGAKKAAELVRDLAVMCADSSSPSVSSDVGHAIRHMVDEMAKVRFANSDISIFAEEHAIPPLIMASHGCFIVEGFFGWKPSSMRRRFMYCLGRKDRTDMAYTLTSLMFGCGFCPLLSLADRRAVRTTSMKACGIEHVSGASCERFLKQALGMMRDAKEMGFNDISSIMTSKQLADSMLEIGVPEGSPEITKNNKKE